MLPVQTSCMFLIACCNEPLGQCAVCNFCFNEVFAAQLRSCLLPAQAVGLCWVSWGFCSSFFLAQPAALISSLLADHEQWTVRRHQFLKSLCLHGGRCASGQTCTQLLYNAQANTLLKKHILGKARKQNGFLETRMQSTNLTAGDCCTWGRLAITFCVLKYAATQMPASFFPASPDHRAEAKLVCPLLRVGLQMYSMNKLFGIALFI